MGPAASYNVSYAGTSYIPWPINVSGLEQASDGRVNELSLSVYNVDNVVSLLVEDPYLVGTSSANSVYGYVNGELVGGIDPRTVPAGTTYTDPTATAVLKSARAKGLVYDANIVLAYGKEFASFDKYQTEATGGVWVAAKSDTRDLLGAAVEIKTTFANFLDYWPEYSLVTDISSNSYAMKNSFPYRVGDTVSTGNKAHCNATVIAIAANNTMTLSRPIVNQLYIGDKENNIQGLYIRPNSSSILVLGVSSDNVYKYSMSSAANIASATLTEGYSVTTRELNPTGITLSATGNLMYVVGNISDNVLQYSLSTAYSPATATYMSNLYIGDIDTNPQDITFNATGSKFYIAGVTGSKVYQYNMSNNWDITTATYNTSLVVADANPRALFLTPTGDSLFVLGQQKASIFQYNLSENDNLASATLYANAYIGNYDTFSTALTFRSNGRQLYLAGNITDTIYQLPLASAWDITTLNIGSVVATGSPLYITNSQTDTESYLQDTYKIDQLEGLSEHVANFSLVSWLQYFKIVTPKRKYYKNTCQWVYKGDECQYPGAGGGTIPGTNLLAPDNAIAANNMIMPGTAGDVCSKSLTACTLRNNSLHFGGFPAVGRSLPQM